MKITDKIFLDLELNDKDGLYITSEGKWKTEISFPNRIKRLIENKIRPDAFFCFDNKPMILFFENCENMAEKHKAIWNFNECPTVIFIDDTTVEIYNGFKFLKDRKTLQKFDGNDSLNDFKYFELVTGKTWEKYKQELDYKNRVDYQLLENIKDAREILINKNETRTKFVNAILGKIIFVRYLIDRKVKISFDGSKRIWRNRELCDLLDNPKQVKAFFNYLDDKKSGFNGDLFPISENEYQQLNEDDYKVLKRLLNGEDISKNQLSLFELYDFSIIPIEFISNVYEQFIGRESQSEEGAYYTPLFLVDYILKETVEKHLAHINNIDFKTNDTQSTKTNNYTYCKVLDPACGSGIFLVETLRKIIEKYIENTKIDTKSKEFKDAIKNLALANIFGVDKDLSAVQVAIFSIYLTLLDYLEPPEIEDAFQFPNLLNTNFFNDNFFDLNASFNNRFDTVEFNFILGNPPWKGKAIGELGNQYLNQRKKKEKSLKKKYQIAINNGEIAEGFILRVSDFCKPQSQIALIIKSTILYNKGYNPNSKFRQYWLEEYFIDRVFELAPVNSEVFDRSNDPSFAPAAILCYRYAYGENTDGNIIQHIALKKTSFFSMFKLFSINRNDYKQVKQERLKEFDWLWKVLVYGSYLDFNFLNRIFKDYTSINDYTGDKTKFHKGTGVQYSKYPVESTEHLVGLPFIDTKGIKPFFINPDDISKFKKIKVGRKRNPELFKAPVLLTNIGLDSDSLNPHSAISYSEIVYKKSLTGISPKNSQNSIILRNILGLLNSELYSYVAINTFSSIGIERPQIKGYEKFNLPYLELSINKNIETIESAKKEIYLEKNNKNNTLIDPNKIQELEKIVQKELDFINKSIYEKLGLDEIELSLIDYALNVNKKLITNKSEIYGVIKVNEPILNDYANVFLERFKSKLDTHENKFIVEIWHTNNIIGMFFKLIPVNEYVDDIIWENKKNCDTDIFSLITKLSSDKITDKLFVQKDLRGFEEDYFYIFKPNEYRLWHKAIGYLDVNDFADAILRAGRDAE